MLCTLCKTGVTSPGFATVMLQRGASTVIIKEVPAEICDNCSEYFLSGDISRRVLQIAEDAVQKGTELEVTRFAA